MSELRLVLDASHGPSSASRRVLMDERSQYPAEPAAASQSAGELAELAGFIASIPACDRILLVQRDGSFTHFVPVCRSHRWVGYETSCEHEAVAQICTHREPACVASARAERLVRLGFTRFEGE